MCVSLLLILIIIKYNNLFNRRTHYTDYNENDTNDKLFQPPQKSNFILTTSTVHDITEKSRKIKYLFKL